MYGARRRLLDGAEIALAAALILIPYVAQADRLCMASQARFASVVFPVYIVFGRLLARLPAGLPGAALAIYAFLLSAYTALFVSRRWF